MYALLPSHTHTHTHTQSMPESSPHAWACMVPLLFNKVAVQLAHLLHARLSPLRFLLNLSLLTLFARILLTLIASSPTLHSLLLSLNQPFNLNLHILQDAAALNILIKAFTLHHLLFFIANSIILALFLTSKGGYLSSSQALICHAYMNLFEHSHDDDDDDDDDDDALNEDPRKPYDIFADIAEYNIPSLASASNQLAIASAPSIEQLELVPTYLEYSNEKSCNTLAIASNQVAIVPTTDTISHENARQRGLIRHKSDREISSNHVANKFNYGRTVSSSYVYECPKEELACTLYTASTIDNLSEEEANKHFSKFASLQWARMRMESQADCEASPPSDLQLLCISS